jgi:hypothetical protein
MEVYGLRRPKQHKSASKMHIFHPLLKNKSSTENYRVLKNFPVRFLGTRFEERNCITEPGPKEL